MHRVSTKQSLNRVKIVFSLYPIPLGYWLNLNYAQNNSVCSIFFFGCYKQS